MLRALRVLASFTVLSACAHAAVSRLDPWVHDSGILTSAENYFGETVANGIFGITSAPAPFKTRHTLLAGTFEVQKAGDISRIVRTFDLLALEVEIDGVSIERLDQVRNFRQALDFRRAAFTTTFDFEDKASITYTMRALRHLPHTALLDVTVTPKRSIKLAVRSVLDAPAPLQDVKMYETMMAVRNAPRGTLRTHASTATGPTRKLLLAAAQALLPDEAPETAPDVTRDGNRLAFAKALPGGAPYPFSLIASVLTSKDVLDPLNETQRLTGVAAVQGKRRLIARHEREWAALWKSGITVEGDLATQRDINSLLYHLYAFAREGSGYSIAPMALSADTYFGHIFWDAELWMFPALLVLQPKMAETMMEYRYQRLPAARRNARAYGYKGAMFPWQSAQSGDEETPVAALAGPLEQHVTADVGIAAWNYYRATQDQNWLRDKGFALISETADFWASRVARNGEGRYDITNVVAADEYAYDVDNNAFTNAAARENLAAATAAAKVLGLRPDPDWEHVRQNIPILKFPAGATREHDTYNGETIKQADVNLLAFPLQTLTDPKDIRRDLDYYVPRVDHGGPAMTKSVFAILYTRLGMPDRAYAMFKDSYVPNQRPPFGVLAETATLDNPYFATGAGGALQTMLFGFGGLEITDRGLTQLRTQLPGHWKSLTLTGVGPDKRTYTVH